MKKDKHKVVKPSDYIRHFPDLPKNSVYLVIARVSSPEQDKKGYLDSQIYRLQKFIADNKIKVAYNTIYGICRGAFWTPKQKRDKHFNPSTTEKPHFPILMLYAGMFKSSYWNTKNKYILVESTDRIIRGLDLYTDVTKAEFKELLRITMQIPIATIIHPDAIDVKVRQYRNRRQNKMPKKKPQDRKKRYATYYPDFLELIKEGKTYGQIYEMLNQKLKKSTIKYWGRMWRKEGV